MIDLLPGVDVSFNQGTIYWPHALTSGIKFAFIRWGQRDEWIDSQAIRNWLAIRSLLLRGAYWVWDARDGATGRDQGIYFIRTFDDKTGGDKGELPPAIDLELNPLDWYEFHVMVLIVEEYFGRKPIIYSGAWFLAQHLPLPDWILDYDFWLTGYNEVGPTLLEGYDLKIVCWQQSNSWDVPGIGGCDRDYWYQPGLGLWRYAMEGKYISIDKLLDWLAINAEDCDGIVPPPPLDELVLQWPTEWPGVVTQWYGVNKHLYQQYGLPGHEGIDMRAFNGTRIFACAPGKVYRVQAGVDGNYGIHVRIEHQIGDKKFKTIYAHFQEALVAVDEEVVAGQVIGLADNTGNSSGAHLHLTLKLEGIGDDSWMPNDIINPVPYVKELWPGKGWRVIVGGNFRKEPVVGNNLIRYISPGPTIQALDFLNDWWKINYNGVVGWFWEPGYKLDAV